MTAPVGRIGALVLAGGRSSRFGRDKLAEPIDGRPMLDRAIEAVRSVASDVVVVAAPNDRRTLPIGVRRVHDREAHLGPLVGLATGLAALEPDIELVIVVGGDMPTLVGTVLVRLVDALTDHEAAVLVDPDGDRPRPLPLAIRRVAGLAACGRLLSSGVAERRLRAVLDELDVDAIPAATWLADDPTGASLVDIDRPADVRR